MPPKICTVRFIDSHGIGHATEIAAETLFEAAVLGVRAFHKSGFIEQMPGAAASFEVEVKEPSVIHKVSLGQVMRWLNQHGTNPAEMAKRKRLRDLLGAGLQRS